MSNNIKYLKEPSCSTMSEVDITQYVGQIIKDIKERGDEALKEYSEKFDGWCPQNFLVTEEQIRRAEKVVPETLKEDLRFSYEQIKNFAKLQLDSIEEFEEETLPGIYLGQKLVAIEKVGVYVPGGRYPLMCSALMSITPAKVAGVECVVSCSPPFRNEGINPKILYAMRLAGADYIFSIGGIQAIAALAYGTETIPSVDKLIGPGNQYVAEAKRLVFGEVGIEFIAGPSEILILADDTADPEIVAADLIAQAEHDPRAKAMLVSTSEQVAQQTLKEIDKLLKKIPTSEIARQSWNDQGWVAVVEEIDQAIELANNVAAEHVHVHMADTDVVLRKLRNYGSLFLGDQASVVFSDKAIGTNHILPTSRAARYTGGVSVFTFLKVVSYQRVDKHGVLTIAPVASRLSKEEGLDAHAYSASLRLRPYES